MPLFTRVRSWYQKAAAPNSDLSSILDTIQEKVSESGFAGMLSYTVCIVEDSAECAAALIDKVAASPFSEGFEVHEMASRAELEYFVSEGHAVDILITDINLGTDAADGISTVRDLFPVGSKTQVIYATGYIEYCTPVYETQHVYFLVKPVRQSALDDALKKALENLAGQSTQGSEAKRAGRGARADVPPESSPCALTFNVRGRTIVVDADRIEYLESERRKLRLHTDGGVMEVYCSLADAQAMLPEGFVRCHKSFVVNLADVVEIGKDDILAKSGSRVPMSQKRRHEVKEALLDYLKARA